MRKAGHVIHLDDWPEQDRIAWQSRFANVDVFDYDNPASRWSRRSRVGIAVAYGRWLAYLDKRGELDRHAAPGDRATPETVIGFAEHLETEVKPLTLRTYVKNLYNALWAMEPERDREWLVNIVSKIWRATKPARNTASVIPAKRLYSLGFELMERADRSSHMHGIGRATLYRDGLMIALLAARPLRRSNLAGLRLGKHLTRAGGVWTLFIPAGETKGGRPIEAPFPTDLREPLERFLQTYRPKFPRSAEHNHLWPSIIGRPLGHNGVYEMIVKRTRAALDVSIYPNLFRVAAATTIATDDPAHFRDARKLLDHKFLSTTERFYNRAQTIDASRRYQGHLDALRARLACGEVGRQG